MGRKGLGTIFLWASGNGDNSNYDDYVNSIYTIAIGAIANMRQQAIYSEPGANLIVVAPSGNAAGENDPGDSLGITTTYRTGTDGYNTAPGPAGNYATDFDGTSSAAPTASGVIALMLQCNPNLGWRDVQEILIKSAVKVNPADPDWVTNAAGYHFSHKFGAGLIDASAAVTEAKTWRNLGRQISIASTLPRENAIIPSNDPTGLTRTFDLSTSNIRVEHVTLRATINHPRRGHLAITLISPSGVASKLAEVHRALGEDYPDWTFMTVHNWGENCAGIWTLKITDTNPDHNSSYSGALTAAELTVFGTSNNAQ